MRSFQWLCMAVWGLTTGVVLAHHSTAMFDMTRKQTVTGTVTKFEWSNPHAWIEMQAPDKDTGKPVAWAIEAPAVTGLARAGWTSTSLKPGDRITVVYHPLKSGGPGGALFDVQLADGRHLGQTQLQLLRDQSGYK